MGNNTRVTGEITVSPPLNYTELRQWPQVLRAAGSRNGWAPLKPEEDRTETETDEGMLVKISCSTLVPYSQSSFSGADSLDNYLNAAIAQWGGDHTFSGFFECVDEEGFWYRVVVGADNKAHTVRPVMTWPEV